MDPKSLIAEMNTLKASLGWKLIEEYIERLKKTHADSVMKDLTPTNNDKIFSTNDKFKFEYKLFETMKNFPDIVKSEIENRTGTITEPNFSPELPSSMNVEDLMKRLG